MIKDVIETYLEDEAMITRLLRMIPWATKTSLEEIEAIEG